ncbi:winged helix-turn-helix domain-containing protein [Streptacidiphilus sp. EB129]|uniref:winged helix-turn-helix domain-containing protein n=1 Tax=Streptacidiphilus sp. EB129 TaxID=3156262 RepID=UPI003513A911
MLRIQFSADDLARVRFAPQPAPLVELKLALMMLRRPDSAVLFGRWRRGMGRHLPSTTQPLWDLVSAYLGPAFIDPVSADLESGLDAVRAAPPALVRAGVDRIRAARGRTAAPWLGDLVDGDDQAWGRLGSALRDAYTTLLAPSWSTVADEHRAEFAGYALTAAAFGVAHTLPTLWPNSRLAEGVWELDAPYQRHVDLAGRGLLLLPTFHWTAVPLVADLHGLPGVAHQPVLLVYPAGPGLPPRPATANGDTLTPVLGATRARALRLLAAPLSTTELAHCLGISLGSASTHVTALRGAGLVSTERDGRAVRHERTALGTLLVPVH